MSDGNFDEKTPKSSEIQKFEDVKGMGSDSASDNDAATLTNTMGVSRQHGHTG